jgi:hypothetical protein
MAEPRVWIEGRPRTCCLPSFYNFVIVVYNFVIETYLEGLR